MQKEKIVMANLIVAGELYYELDGQLSEIKRQLRQPNGYPFNPFQLKLHLQAAIEGRFGPGEIYRVKLGGPTTTDDIARQWREAGLYVNDYITQANFPLKPHAVEDSEIGVIDPGCSFTEEEGLKFLKAAGLDQPTDEHALRFAEQCGRTTTGKKLLIIFLHKPWLDPDRDWRVVCLGRYAEYRGLDLVYPDDGFNDGCVLAGVRPSMVSELLGSSPTSVLEGSFHLPFKGPRSLASRIRERGSEGFLRGLTHLGLGDQSEQTGQKITVFNFLSSLRNNADEIRDF